MPPWLRNLDEIILLALFVVVPVLQRVFQHLAKRRVEATLRERARRADEAPPLPADLEPQDTMARGRERWRELLTELSEVEEEEASPPPAPPPQLPPPPPPRLPKPVRMIVPFEPQALGGLPPAPTEDQLEGPATVARAPLMALEKLETLDVHEAVEPLADLPGLVAAAPRAAQAETLPRARLRGPSAAAGWRRAVVLSELLQAPVALRVPGTLAPGLGDLT